MAGKWDRGHLQSNDGEDYHKRVEREDISDAEGEAKNHAQNTDPAGTSGQLEMPIVDIMFLRCCRITSLPAVAPLDNVLGSAKSSRYRSPARRRMHCLTIVRRYLWEVSCQHLNRKNTPVKQVARLALNISEVHTEVARCKFLLQRHLRGSLQGSADRRGCGSWAERFDDIHGWSRDVRQGSFDEVFAG